MFWGGDSGKLLKSNYIHFQKPQTDFFFFFFFADRHLMDAGSKKQGSDSHIKRQYRVCKDQNPGALSGTKMIERQEQSNVPAPSSDVFFCVK